MSRPQGFAANEGSGFLAEFCPRQKIHSRTLQLRTAVLAALESAEPPVSVRQLYYLAASRGAVSKDESGYRKVQRQVLAMRREGLIPYAYVADNTRWRIKPATESSLTSFLTRVSTFYRQDLWIGSPAYVEVWCEKDSIAGVISPVTDEYDVPLYVARGYSSETFAYAAASHMHQAARDGKRCHVYYCGDFDPSGWDASRDLECRLLGFFPAAAFQRLAILPEHLPELITRSTKVTDSRAKRFFATFGAGFPSCELEALHPNRLRALVRAAIEQHVDRNHLAALEREEIAARETLREFTRTLRRAPHG